MDVDVFLIYARFIFVQEQPIKLFNNTFGRFALREERLETHALR